MERTPRRVLEQRALTGNWLAFPVSPAPYYAQLRDTVGDGDYDYSGTSAVVVLLEVAGGALLAGSRTELERLAIHRAMLTVCIGAMEQVDDSLADLAEHFREQERAYLELLRAHADAPGLLRDLLELAIWENYGLFEGVEDFLSTLPGAERERELAQRELDAIEGELRAAELDAQLRRARALQRVLRTPHPVDAGAPPGSPAIASVGFVSSWRRRT
jgi:hypothetical protein